MSKPGSTAAPPADFYRPGEYTPEQSVGFLVRKVMVSILAQADRELAPHDLTHAQWLPLYKLVTGQAHTVAAVARELEMDPGAMTRALDRLEAKGLIRRERSLVDRRVVQLHLTDEGQTVARKVPAVLAGVLNAHLAGFDAADWQQLLQLLHRVLANGEQIRAGATPQAAGRPRGVKA